MHADCMRGQCASWALTFFALKISCVSSSSLSLLASSMEGSAILRLLRTATAGHAAGAAIARPEACVAARTTTRSRANIVEVRGRSGTDIRGAYGDATSNGRKSFDPTEGRRPRGPGLLPRPALPVWLILQDSQQQELPHHSCENQSRLLPCRRPLSLPLLCLSIMTPRPAWCSGARGTLDIACSTLGAEGGVDSIHPRLSGSNRRRRSLHNRASRRWRPRGGAGAAWCSGAPGARLQASY